MLWYLNNRFLSKAELRDRGKKDRLFLFVDEKSLLVEWKAKKRGKQKRVVCFCSDVI